ncbi:hypothetical protein ACFYXC_30600 [Streptomyces sp. NPDC002701]|uniref:hypothetical protein n=1 Tax=Streptomyces sp. NPDC002701 TaxID=3364661 RepID=UPI00367DE247
MRHTLHSPVWAQLGSRREQVPDGVEPGLHGVGENRSGGAGVFSRLGLGLGLGLGLAGIVLMSLLVVGVRAGHPRWAWWSAGLFFLLTLQLQT